MQGSILRMASSNMWRMCIYTGAEEVGNLNSSVRRDSRSLNVHCCWRVKKHFNIILPSVPRSSRWSLSLRFPHKTLYAPLLLPIHATWPAHLILHLITHITSDEEYRSLHSSLCSLLHSPVTLPLLGPNIFLSTLFSHTLILYMSLSATEQVSHPYKTAGKIIFYIF